MTQLLFKIVTKFNRKVIEDFENGSYLGEFYFDKHTKEYKVKDFDPRYNILKNIKIDASNPSKLIFVDKQRNNTHLVQNGNIFTIVVGDERCSKDAKSDYDPNLKYTNDDYDKPPEELLKAVEDNLPNVSFYTEGNQIKIKQPNQEDKPFVPLGVSGTGAQYDYEPLSICTDFEKLQTLVKDWKVNTYRLPIGPDTYIYGKDLSKNLISVKEYKYYIDTILIRCISAGFKLVILDIHLGGGGTQMDQTGHDCFYNLLQKYKDIPVIAFEPLNEYPTTSSENINEWYNGRYDGKDQIFYGVKNMLEISRNKDSMATFTKNLLIIGGVDFSYQSGFLGNNISDTQDFNIDTVIDKVKTMLPDDIPDKDKAIGIIINTHPYGYKGVPYDSGCATSQIPVNTIDTVPNPDFNTPTSKGTYSVPDIDIFNKSDDPVKTIEDKNNYINWGPIPKQMGWIDSFGYLVQKNKVPVIMTEFGLNQTDSCIEGGFYNIALTNWVKFLNQEIQGSIGIIGWALSYTNLEFVSLLTGDCKELNETGEANNITRGPPTEGPFGYEGPGKQYKAFLNSLDFSNN